MNDVLKIVLFLLFGYGICLAGYKLYVFLNHKIIGSRSLLPLLGYALLLIACNVALFFGGLLLFLKLYEYLSI